jgi:hypothetical protein
VSFGSTEEMFDALAAMEDRANAEVTDAQRAVLADDVDSWFMRPYEDILIFGHAWGADHRREVSMGYVPERPSAVSGREQWDEYEEAMLEAQAEIEHYTESRERGYLFGECFSIHLPDGEPGQTHVVSVVPISQAAFEEARAAGWQAVVRVAGDDDAYPPGTPTLVGELMAHEFEVQHARERGTT